MLEATPLPLHQHLSAQSPRHLLDKFTLNLSVRVAPALFPHAWLQIRSWKSYMHNEGNYVIDDIIAPTVSVSCKCQVIEVIELSVFRIYTQCQEWFLYWLKSLEVPRRPKQAQREHAKPTQEEWIPQPLCYQVSAYPECQYLTEMNIWISQVRKYWSNLELLLFFLLPFSETCSSSDQCL